MKLHLKDLIRRIEGCAISWGADVTCDFKENSKGVITLSVNGKQKRLWVSQGALAHDDENLASNVVRQVRNELRSMGATRIVSREQSHPAKELGQIGEAMIKAERGKGAAIMSIVQQSTDQKEGLENKRFAMTHDHIVLVTQLLTKYGKVTGEKGKEVYVWDEGWNDDRVRLIVDSACSIEKVCELRTKHFAPTKSERDRDVAKAPNPWIARIVDLERTVATITQRLNDIEDVVTSTKDKIA